jgi:ABC-type Fe3+/spermidine/putrescine transport system ATPase subunit
MSIADYENRDESFTKIVQLEHVTKEYPGAKTLKALDDLTLDIIEGEFLVALGPSGSGKTT